MSFAAVIVAAGSGQRFGGAKHLMEIDGTPLWKLCERVLTEAGAESVVVVGDVPGGIQGGDRRRDSVAAGIRTVADSEFVLVHDAARPLATVALIERVVARLTVGDVDGVIPVIPVRDALKHVLDGMVAASVDRSNMAAVQTPQGFVTRSLVQAHAHSSEDAADDAELIERWGGTVATVQGDATNVKITYPEDLALARAMWSGRT